MLQLDSFLRVPDGAGHERVRDHLSLLGPGLLHPAGNTIRREQAHQVVLEREEESRLTRVALAARAPAQLPIYASRLVSFGPYDRQPAY